MSRDFTLAADKLERISAYYNGRSNLSAEDQTRLQMFKQVAELQDLVKQGVQLNDEQIEFMRLSEERAFFDLHNTERALKYASQTKAGRDVATVNRELPRGFEIER